MSMFYKRFMRGSLSLLVKGRRYVTKCGFTSQRSGGDVKRICLFARKAVTPSSAVIMQTDTFELMNWRH
ncbi:hypothetical protein DB395_31110 [Pseudomonas aeruginosa]|nr:hypothetical protein APA43_34190 [Pseudomonas aeruginosa]OPE15992.1 hypothetical protein APA76_32250 [Pseudomonas aeruginosa]OTI37112.1 hypothetical protein CAY97_20265 [Pseudomonas aeruginosa]PTZ30075.1 hypothetical protein DB395_31110 [Pseudomonas aeruginosa]RAP60260.1 hypothetical protein AXW85_31580 [Pseudomonas aeruginosa]